MTSDRTTRTWWQPQRRAELSRLLWHRRWWRCTSPFPHVRAVNVFRPAVYTALERAYSQWQQEADGGSQLSGHDLCGATITSAWTGPLCLFASPGWHDLIAGVTGVSDVTGHINLGLHHHEPYSAPGFPHTDLNPGWFAEEPADRVVLAEPSRVEYTSGVTRDSDTSPVQVVRAVAVLFYLANPRWKPDHQGQTGLYRSARDAASEPCAAIAPHPNSLVAFECTPWSFHGFVGGGSAPRNSVVQWLHRRPAAVDARWGEGVVVGYGEGEK